MITLQRTEFLQALQGALFRSQRVQDLLAGLRHEALQQHGRKADALQQVVENGRQTLLLVFILA